MYHFSKSSPAMPGQSTQHLREDNEPANTERAGFKGFQGEIS